MLYIMRHGRTDWNERNKLQGRTDIPLNAAGRKMAEEAAAVYKNVPLDVCYCSPLARARQTAEIFLKNRNIPIITDDRLVEMSFGIYEGMENPAKATDSPIRTFFTEQSARALDCPINILFKEPEKYKAVEGGESIEKLFERTGDFLRNVVEPQLEDGKNIVIIGHGAMNSGIICQVRGLSTEHFWDAGINQCELLQLK